MRDLLALFGYLRPYKKATLAGALCTCISTTLALLIPLAVGRAIDDLLLTATWEKLTRYALLILSLSISSGLLLFLQRRYLTGMACDVEGDLRRDIYAHLQRQPLSFFQRRLTGDLMAHAVNDVIAVRQLTGPLIMYSLQMAFTVAITLVLMLRIHVGMTLVLFFVVPLVSPAVRRLGRQVQVRFAGIQNFYALMSARAQENITGARLVRAYGVEGEEGRAFDALNRRYAEMRLGLVRVSALLRPLIELIVGVSYALIILYGGALAVRGAVTVGQLAEFSLYVIRLSGALVVLGELINLYQRGSASLGRLNALFDIKPAIADAAGVKPGPPIAGRVELRHLHFAYDEDRGRVLHDINLTIEAGQTVALVGPTGSGKSTLMGLIPRLLESPPGTVWVDGAPVQDYPLAQLRAAIGYVPQETFLFSDTIAGNIAFGDEAARREEIEWAASVAGMNEDLRGFPDGLDTVVGERGLTLSGGQKQRTAIARAVLRRPRILLLDDALSSVDTYTEKKILDGLREVTRASTCLIISHRVSTTFDADLVYVLDGGRIIEWGRPRDLLAGGGVYAALYRRQMLREEAIEYLSRDAGGDA